MRIGIITDPPTVVHSCAVVGGQLAKHLVKLGQEVHLLGYNYGGDILEHRDGYRLHPDKPQPPVGELSVRAFLEKTRVQVLYAHAAPGVFGGAISASRSFGVPFLPHTFSIYIRKPTGKNKKCSRGQTYLLGKSAR